MLAEDPGHPNLRIYLQLSKKSSAAIWVCLVWYPHGCAYFDARFFWSLLKIHSHWRFGPLSASISRFPHAGHRSAAASWWLRRPHWPRTRTLPIRTRRRPRWRKRRGAAWRWCPGRPVMLLRFSCVCMLFVDCVFVFVWLL